MLPTWMSILAMPTLLTDAGCFISGVASPVFLPILAEANSFLERIGYTVVVAVISSVIGSAMAIAVMRTKIQHLTDSLEKTNEAIDDHAEKTNKAIADHAEKISALSEKRADCELRSTREYATRGELARLIVDNSRQFSLLDKKLDDGLRRLHERINNVDKGLAAIEAREKTKEPNHANA